MNTNSQDDMDELPIPEDEIKRIVSALIKMMEMCMGAVYGKEDENRVFMQCTVWDYRPLRCRRYDCTNNPLVWTKDE